MIENKGILNLLTALVEQINTLINEAHESMPKGESGKLLVDLMIADNLNGIVITALQRSITVIIDSSLNEAQRKESLYQPYERHQLVLPKMLPLHQNQ